MKLLVRGMIIDTSHELVAIYLNEQDRRNIKNMAPEARIFISCPTGSVQKEVDAAAEKLLEEVERPYCGAV